MGMEYDDSETPSPGFEEFRAKLVTHFSVAWTKREVVWFQRAAVAEAYLTSPICLVPIYNSLPSA